jgi:hypothetical protein
MKTQIEDQRYYLGHLEGRNMRLCHFLTDSFDFQLRDSDVDRPIWHFSSQWDKLPLIANLVANGNLS